MASQARAEQTAENSKSTTIEGTVVVAANPGNGNAAVRDNPGRAADVLEKRPARGNAAATSVPGTSVDGAVVRALADDGTVLDTEETDGGAFSLEVCGVSPTDVRVVCVLNGEFELDGQRLYAAAERLVSDSRTDVNFTFTDAEIEATVDVDGEDSRSPTGSRRTHRPTATTSGLSNNSRRSKPQRASHSTARIASLPISTRV